MRRIWRWVPSRARFLLLVFRLTSPSHALFEPYFRSRSSTCGASSALLIAVLDLRMVLSVFQLPPFEKIREIPLLRCLKVAFLLELVALSCRFPYLVLYKDKVVLRPCPFFLPKVISAFQLNEDIILPSPYPHQSHPKEIALHVVWVIRVYPSASEIAFTFL